MNGDLEMQVRFRTDSDEPIDKSNSQNEHGFWQQVTECEDQSHHNNSEATEEDHLLPQDQNNGVHSVQPRRRETRRYVFLITLEKEDPEAGQESIPLEPLRNNNGESIPLVPQTNNNGESIPQDPQTNNNGESIPQDPQTNNNGESIPLVSQTNNNGESIPLEPQTNNNRAEPESGTGKRGLVWRLNQKIVWKLRLWMFVAIGLLLLTIFAIALGLSLWRVLYEDEDDKFDRESFVVPLFYSGSVRLANQNFTEDLLSPTSKQSLVLSTWLEETFSGVYSSSPALGRYFSSVDLYAFRNGSVTAYYWLKFLMPLEHKELVQFTLSREMVYNVLRQHLYDMQSDANSLLYIDPSAIYMEVGNRTLASD